MQNSHKGFDYRAPLTEPEPTETMGRKADFSAPFGRYEMTKKNAPDKAGAFMLSRWAGSLELAPQKLVVHVVVELHFAALHDGAQQTRATIG